MSDPLYRTDVNALAEELRRTQGPSAYEFAVSTAKEHLQAAAWKHCALWLQVVNRLDPPAVAAIGRH